MFFCSDHFLKLKIYYGELDFEVIEEEEAYTVRRQIYDYSPCSPQGITLSHNCQETDKRICKLGSDRCRHE